MSSIAECSANSAHEQEPELIGDAALLTAGGEPATASDSGVVESPVALSRGDTFVSGVVLLLTLSIAQRIIGFARNILVCRYLAPEELGRWNLAFNAIEIIAPLVVLGLPGTMARYLESFRQQGRARWFLLRLAITTATLAGVGLGLLAAFRPTVAWAFFSDAEQTPLLNWVLPSLVVVVAYNFLLQLSIALRKPRVLSLLHFANSLLFAAFSLVLLRMTNLGAAGLVASYGLACSFGVVFAICSLRRPISELQDVPLRDPHIDASQNGPAVAIWSRLLPLAGALWLNDSLCNAFYTADRVMLVHLADPAAGDPLSIVGQYHSSRVLGVLIAAMGAMLAQVFLPYLARDWEAGEKSAVSRQINFALKVVAFTLTLISIAVLAVAPVLFGQVMQGKYMDGFEVLPATMTYCIWFGMLMIVQNYLWLAEQAKWANLAVAIALVMNVGLNLVLVPAWGLPGAVCATTLANLALLGLALQFSRRLGLQLHVGIIAAIALPASLIAGPLVAGLCALATLVIALQRSTVLSAWERAQVDTMLQKLRRRWPSFTGQTTSN